MSRARTAADGEMPVATLRSTLRKRFGSPEWAYFEEVRNGTGFTRRQDRTADALAFGLWPSRGLELHGIEIKSARGDWLREKKNPEKAEELFRFCERWWLVSEMGVARDDEIPSSWGWMEFDGKRLRQWKEAPKLEAQQLDRPMIAAILRKASEGFDAAVEAAVQPMFSERIAAEREHHATSLERAEKRAADADRQRQRAEALLAEVGRAVGVGFWIADYPRRLIEGIPDDVRAKLEAFSAADVGDLRRRLVESANLLRDAATNARRLLRAAGVRSNAGPRRGR